MDTPRRRFAIADPTILTAGSVWALLLGMGLLMLGNGMQGILLGLRATTAGFSSTVTGIVMAGYFAGFLGSTVLAPIIIRRVGHVRTFAAMASLASTAILVHAMLVTPVVWVAMRAVTGFAYCGLFIVTESWLNDRASNDVRGRLLSIYLMINYFTIGGGQLTINLASPSGYTLFLLNAIVLSLALVPILVSTNREPDSSSPEPLGLLRLYRISPLGTVGAFSIGMTQGAIFGMAAVFAHNAELSVAQVSVFMAVLIAGGALLQWPIGRLSDHIDRRRVITGVALSAAMIAALMVPVGHLSNTALVLTGFLLGGTVLPMYSLYVAYTNDHLQPNQMVAASSGLYKAVAIGAVIGPIATGWLMDLIGATGFLWYFVAIHLAVVGYALHRMRRSKAPAADEQWQYAPVPGATAAAGTGELAEAWVEQITTNESAADDDDADVEEQTERPERTQP